MSRKAKDIEKTTVKKPDDELSEKELEQASGGIGMPSLDLNGRQTTPKIMPYVEQDNLRK